MSTTRHALIAATLTASLLCVSSRSQAQQPPMPTPTPEHALLKKDVGIWDAEIRSWESPDSEPTITKGRETNRMLGEFWLITDFEGTMMGLKYRGQGIYGYDANKKQFTGTWYDSLGSPKMELTGKQDSGADTITYHGMAAGPDGNDFRHTFSTAYHADGTRVMTMSIGEQGDMMKIMEIHYTRRATGSGKK